MNINHQLTGNLPLSVLLNLHPMFTQQRIPFSFTYIDETDTIKMDIEAVAQLSGCKTFYEIQQFSSRGRRLKMEPISIKCIKSGKDFRWIHTDSERPSKLSDAIGNTLLTKIVFAHLLYEG